MSQVPGEAPCGAKNDNHGADGGRRSWTGCGALRLLLIPHLHPLTPGGKAVAVLDKPTIRTLTSAFRTINVELRKDAPDKAVLATNASQMKDLAAAPFQVGSPRGADQKPACRLAAKAEIWTDAAGFAAVATGLQTETAKLAEVATAMATSMVSKQRFVQRALRARPATTSIANLKSTSQLPGTVVREPGRGPSEPN